MLNESMRTFDKAFNTFVGPMKAMARSSEVLRNETFGKLIARSAAE